MAEILKIHTGVRTIAVEKYMTYVPKTIGSEQSVAVAAEYMRKLHIRHLPVLKRAKLVGVLTLRDIILSCAVRKTDPANLLVEEIFSTNVYFTNSKADLLEVATQMAKHESRCVLVVDNGKLIGIFTEVDALRALGDLIAGCSISK